MGILTPGWLKKALHLRVIVSCAPIKDLSDDDLALFTAMREFRRGTITFEELKKRKEAVAGSPLSLLHEPAEIYGWHIRGSLFGWNSVPWWLVGVHRRNNTASDKDKTILIKVLAALGCDDPARDQLSIGELDENVAAGVPFMYAWRNTIELQEVQVNKQKRGRDMMRIVPRGSRASDGYEKLDVEK